MNTQLILTTVIITTLFSVFFVILINFKNRKADVKKLDFRGIATQLIALTVWVTILANILLTTDGIEAQYSIGIFLASVVIGVFLIKSLFEETRYQEIVSKLIKRLQNNNTELRRLDEQKTEFVSLASHQLRGPLAVIHGYLSMILDGDYGNIPEEAREPLYRSLRSSKALSLLINDYLDVAQIEKGEMEYTICDLDISKLLEEIISEFRIISEKARLDFTFTNSSTGLIVRADKNKMRQVISNIIDNAIKYTKEGSVEIEMKTENGYVIVSVKDSGIGIEKGKENEIFTKFSRSESAIKMNVVGTGLGLFVAKLMIEAQDGKVTVDSEGLGKGSTFKIFLPIVKEN
jgi:signal transduction histidine kinase